MSYKIEIQNNFFVVTDTATGIEEIREVRDQVKWRVSGSIYSFFYNIANLIDQNSPNIIRLGENAKEFDFSEIVDSTETPFASRAIFNDLLNVNLGFMIRETSSVWGLITGDINDQTDLQTILNGKFDVPTGDTTQYIAGDGTLITFPIAGQAGTLVREVRNRTGATLTKGTIVYINGANGNKPTIDKALATSDATSAQTFGFLQTNIANNANGYAVVMGDLIGLDTSGITEGTQLYLSSTVAGEYTTTKQVAPAHMVYVGIVTRSHATLGQIEVKIQNGYELDELHDVLISGQTDGQVLQFEGASGLWKNKTLATGLTVGSTSISSGTNGRVLFQNGGVLQQSANLFWDNTNLRLGIGTNAPAYPLDVFGSARVRSLTGFDSTLLIESNTNEKYALLSLKSGSGSTWTIGTCNYQFSGALIIRSGASGTEKLAIFSNGNVNVNSTTDLGAKLGVLAQGALSTDIAFRIRNSANTDDLFSVNGTGGFLSTYFWSFKRLNGTTLELYSLTTGFSFREGGTPFALLGLNESKFGNTNSNDSILGIRTSTAYGGEYPLGSILQGQGTNGSVVLSASNGPANKVMLGYYNGTSWASALEYNNTASGGAIVKLLQNGSGAVSIGQSTNGARLDIRAQGALSTDLALRVRNSANTGDLLLVTGNGFVQTGVGGLAIPRADTPGGTNNAIISHETDGTIRLNKSIQVSGVYGRSGFSNSQVALDLQYGSVNMRCFGGAGNTGFIFNTIVATTGNHFMRIINGSNDFLNVSSGGGFLFTNIASTSFAMPNASAKVQIDSTTQGFLPPRMTNAQRTAIASPAVGLMVYCTDALEGLYIYKSMGWTFVI
jgi:hypothetical protein